MITTSKERLDLIKIVTAAIIWGVGYPFWKIIAEQIHPLLFISIAFIFAAAFMAVIYRPAPSRIIKHLTGPSLPILITFGLSAGLFGTGLCVYALSVTDSGVVSVLEKLQPIPTVILACVVLKETVSFVTLPFMILAIVLSVFVAVPDVTAIDLHSSSVHGMLAAAGSALFYGANTVFCKILMKRGISTYDIAFLRMLLGGLFILPVLPFVDVNFSNLINLSLFHWGIILSISVFGLVVAYNLFTSSLETVSANTASFIELLCPAVALLMGNLILGERLTGSQWIAIPMLLICIVIISIKPKRSA